MATARALSVSDLINEKRISRITLRLSDTLRESIQRWADQAGTTMSSHVVNLLAMGGEMQAEDGQTWSDKISALKRALDLAESDDHLTAAQKLYVIGRLTSVQQMILAGKRRNGDRK